MAQRTRHRPDAAVIPLFRRAKLVVPETPIYEVAELIRQSHSVLSEGERLQQERAKLVPKRE